LLNAHCWWIKQIAAFLCFAANNYYLVINLLIIFRIIDISIRCQKILKNVNFNFLKAQGIVFKLLVLSDQQSKAQRLSAYYHT